MLQVNLNNLTLKSGQPVQTFNVNQLGNFGLSFDTDPGKLYTVKMVDLDAPYPSNPTSSPLVHYLVINIPGGQSLSQGDEIYSYLYPNPPTNSAAHRYVVTVYEQGGPLNIKSTGKRTNFLTPTSIGREIASLTFKVTAQTGKLQEITQVQPVSQDKSNWIKSNSTLNEQEQKYCRCVLEVAAKQPGQCNMEKAWFEERQGETCYNPYAVCAKTVGTSSRVCGENYNWSALPDEMLRSYANLNNIRVNGYSRQEVLKGIVQWKSMKGKN